MRARYAQADALFDAGEYELAAKGFAELGSYEDAKQRVNASEDAWLGKTYNSAKLDMDLGDYAAVVDELDGKTTYTYDALDNIAKVTDVLRQVTSYTYDKNGNQSPGNTSNTFVYDTSDIRVVVNSNGDVITVILNRR